MPGGFLQGADGVGESAVADLRPWIAYWRSSPPWPPRGPRCIIQPRMP